MKVLPRLLSVLILFVFIIFGAPAAHAQSQCPSAFSSLCSVDFSKGAGVGAIVQIIMMFAIVAALAFLIWGGVRWIVSGGDRAKIEQARGTIIASIVGLVIALSAYFIVGVLLQIFTGQGFGGLMIPKLYSR